MDTRSKIVAAETAPHVAAELKRRGIRVKTIAGTFDVLRETMVSELEQEAGPTTKIFALVSKGGSTLLSCAARVELAAALRMIDYVVEIEGDSTGMAALLGASVHISHEAAHRESTQRLIERVLEAHDRQEQRRHAH